MGDRPKRQSASKAWKDASGPPRSAYDSEGASRSTSPLEWRRKAPRGLAVARPDCQRPYGSFQSQEAAHKGVSHSERGSEEEQRNSGHAFCTVRVSAFFSDAPRPIWL